MSFFLCCTTWAKNDIPRHHYTYNDPIDNLVPRKAAQQITQQLALAAVLCYMLAGKISELLLIIAGYLLKMQLWLPSKHWVELCH